MASNPNIRELVEAISSGSQTLCNLRTISFILLSNSASSSSSSSSSSSWWHQDTPTSIAVHISKDTLSSPFLSLLLQALATAHRSLLLPQHLQSLDFRGVQWVEEEPDQMHSLGLLLQQPQQQLGDPSSSSAAINRLGFHGNRFSGRCLQRLSEILKGNGVVKEITFSESRIGPAGATLLADVLKANQGLEELRIWEDSIGSRGAEALSHMLQLNSTLRMLTLFDSTPAAAAPIISAVLGRNRALEVHVWSGNSNKGLLVEEEEEGAASDNSNKVLELVPGSGGARLRIYRDAGGGGSRRVACSLGFNSTVTSLDMSGVGLKTRWAKEFRWVLEQNQTLREVKLSRTGLRDKGVAYVAAGLFKNQRVERLYLDGNRFGGTGLEHLLCPLSRFSALQHQANTTLREVAFGGRSSRIRSSISSILRMLTTNQTLTRLAILEDESLRPQDIAHIFKSLGKKNASLRSLSLQGCKGVRGDEVLDAITHALQLNPWIEELDLSRTPLDTSGVTQQIYQMLPQQHSLDITPPEAEMDMPLSPPKVCRLYLCGQEFAGKTTLCNSISHHFSSSSPPYLDQLRRTLVTPVEQAGIKIKTLRHDDDMRISVWNIAGLHQSCALHHLMFPGHGTPSFFLITSSLCRKTNNRDLKTAAEVEEDIQHWLRHIVSNSRRASQQYMLPNVTLVLTHFDRLTEHSPNMLATAHSIQRLRNKFQGYVELCPTVFTVDARSSVSVSKLCHHLRKTSKTILRRVPQVYELCNDLTKILADWRSENHNRPAMKWTEFSELCQVQVPFLRIGSRHDKREKVEMRRHGIANCLHDMGEVIYFDELSSLILDCEWLCTEVLTPLLKLDIRRKQTSTGDVFICRKELEGILKGLGSKILDNLDHNDLLKLMLKLELCYEQDPSNPNSLLLVPSVLEDGKAKPLWQLNVNDCVYVGRRLECDDSSHMFLTPGFFPRLQVCLHNKVTGLKDQHGASYNLEKHLISININGINVRIELGRQSGYHIDILACSKKNLTETLRLFQQLIIPAIQSLCSGITWTENVLRPECVKCLTPPRYRKTQFISLQRLKEALLSFPADSMYDYQHTWNQVLESGRTIVGAGFDFARDLLSDDDFREVLHRRYHDLYNLAAELNLPEDENMDGSDRPAESDTIDPTLGGIAKGVEMVLQRLRIIEQVIIDLKQEIQGLRYYEHRLLVELNRKVNFLVTYNVQVEERKTPNMFYFVQTANYARRLVTNIVPGMSALRLHMLCEFRGEMHVIEEQIGCEVFQVDSSTVKSLAPYTKKFMALLTCALKIGAHLVAGMGGMIPDLSREVAHLVESSVVSGAGGVAGAAAAGAFGAAAAGALGAAAAGKRHRSKAREASGNIQHDLSTAQQWIMDFLREHRCSSGGEIAEKFSLWRARYRDDGQVAWICRRHLQIRAQEVIEVPV